MIVTVTPNPSLDRTIDLAGPLRVGAVQQASAIREDAGGKGVNVARVLHLAGDDVRAVVPLADGDPYAAAVRSVVPVIAARAAGPARANIALTGPGGETTKINLPGPALDARGADSLVEVVVAACAEHAPQWLALCGSLPPGAPDDAYVRIIRAVRERVARPPRIAVDASGAALAAVVDAGSPDLITPNEDELAELAGRDLPRDVALDRAVAEIAAALVPRSVGAALVTLGGDGAVLVTADGSWSAPVPGGVAVRSTVGAGDSALAGYLHAALCGEPEPARLVAAVRHGSATAALPGTRLASPADLPGAVPATPID